MRLFVGTELSDGARAALDEATGPLRPQLPMVRWAPTAKLHVTLHFLGAAAPEALAAIERALRGAVAGCRPHVLRLAGIQGAPNPRAPRMVWARLGGDLEEVARLREVAGGALAPLGFAVEPRPFQPHITLGRVARDASNAQRRTIAHTITQGAAPPGVEWPVTALVLFESIGGPDGSHYVKRVEVGLERASRPDGANNVK